MRRVKEPLDMPVLSLIAAVHVLAAVLWIGGIAFATLALLPAMRSSHAEVLANTILRFRRVALASSVLLLATGLLQLNFNYGGFSFLTFAIILVPRREIPKLQKLVGAGEENTREFGAFLDRIQKVHYAVLAFGTVLVINGMLAVFGV